MTPAACIRRTPVHRRALALTCLTRTLKPSVMALLSLLAGPAFAAPGLIRRAPAADRLPDQYIVVLTSVARADVPLIAAELLARHGGTLRVTFNNATAAFSAALTEQQALALTYDPRVAIVEENRRIYPASSQDLPADGRLWGLDRIDQRVPISSGDHTYNYCEQAGSVIAYVADTGINRDHIEFLRTDGSSRVINGVKFASDHYVRPGEFEGLSRWLLNFAA